MTGTPVRHLSLTEMLVLAAVLVGGIFGSALDRSLVRGAIWEYWPGPTTVAKPIWATATSSIRCAQSYGGDW